MQVLRLAFAAFAVALGTSAVGADEGWERVSERSGIAVDRRPVAGSTFYEFRATVRTPLAPRRIAAALWADRASGKFSLRFRKRHQILEDGPNERPIYEQINTPVVNDREYTVRLKRRVDGAGVVRLEFKQERGVGPTDPACVPAAAIRGGWTVTPTADGGSEIVYVVYTDPGGSIPSFFVHATQASSTRDVVSEVLDWAAAHEDAGR